MKKLLPLPILLLFLVSAEAEDIFSCKQVGDARVSSHESEGSNLYGPDASERHLLAQEQSKVLRISDTKELALGDKKYSWLGWSGYSAIYSDRYDGLVEVYCRKEGNVCRKEDETTLFVTRSNGSGPQWTNSLAVQVWHCSK